MTYCYDCKSQTVSYKSSFIYGKKNKIYRCKKTNHKKVFKAYRSSRKNCLKSYRIFDFLYFPQITMTLQDKAKDMYDDLKSALERILEDASKEIEKLSAL